MTAANAQIGAWIRLNFSGAYRLTKVMVKNWTCGADEHNAFKDISFQSSYGEPVGFTLNKTTEWQTIQLEGMREFEGTTYVKISGISIFENTADHSGFGELKVFGWL